LTLKNKAMLLARLERRYRLDTKRISIGDIDFEIIGVADPDQVLLEMEQGIRACGAEQPRWQPYWAQSWESAVAIGHALVTIELADKHVLDLGCGLGLAGTVAAARGARTLLADAAQPSLLFARYNSWAWRDHVQTVRIDWRQDTLQQKFDWILGADIVYDVSDWQHLDLHANGTVLLAEPSRDNADALAPYLQQRGWRVSVSHFVIPNRARPIRLLWCTKS
jgi:predicted nicotinamide N-methyase